jgi:DHA1 family bicyclomycin/chloramphenicol resistance-like MFS transporter
MIELTDNVAAETMGVADADLDAAPATPATRFGPSAYWLILLLGSLSGLGPLAIDMYLPSFPAIEAEFHASPPQVERTLAIYFLGLALGQLVYGPLGDRVGRKRPLYAGLTLFILASLGCAFAPGVRSLLVLRFCQALGGCAEMVMARAIVRDRFHERDAARVFSSLMLVMGVAPILAPLIGGQLVAHVGWRAIFGIIAAFAGVCLAAVTFGLPESLPADRRERRSAREVAAVYGQLVRNRTLIAHSVSGSLVLGGVFAYVAGAPFLFMNLFHVRPEHFGLFFGTNAAGLIAGSQVNGYLVRRIDPRRVLRAALVVAAIAGAALLVMTTTRPEGFIGILVPLFAFLCCFGFVVPTSTALAMAPHGRVAGNASAVLGSIQFLVGGSGGLMVSLLHNDTAVPMAAVIAACGAVALGVNLFGTDDRPA